MPIDHRERQRNHGCRRQHARRGRKGNRPPVGHGQILTYRPRAQDRPNVVMRALGVRGNVRVS
jgi:hypothetical protein